MADYWFSAIVALVSVAVPGILILLPFAKRAGMPFPLAAGFGVAVGMVLVPLMGFAESLVGITFSFSTALLNIAIISVAGAALCIKEKAFPEIKPVEDKRAFFLSNWHWPALLIIILLAFWLRSLSNQPYIYEFDPYFYLRTTQFIVQEGAIPASDDLAWYPNLYTHRERPLTHYLTAGWYLLANPGGIFDKEALYTAAAPYPPLMAALAAFMLFALVNGEWGRKWGVAAAALFAFTPAAIMKFAAGVVEQQPWGIFALLFFCAAYCLYLKKGGRFYAVLAGIALLGAVLGSKQDVLAILIFAAFLSLQSLRDFLSGKMGEKALVDNAIVAAGGIAGVLLMLPYRAQGFAGAVALLGAMGFSAFLLGLVRFEQDKGKRQKYLLAAVLLALLALFLTPIGPWVLNYAKAGEFLGPRSTLFSTVIEEMPTQREMALQLGFIGAQLGGVGLPAILLSLSALLLLGAAMYRNSSIAVMLLLLVFPLAWLGFDTAKFVVHLATVLPVAFAALFGELEFYARTAAKKEKPLSFAISLDTGQAVEEKRETPDYMRYAPLAVLALGCMLVLAQVISVLGDASASFSGAYISESGGWNCEKLLKDRNYLSVYMLCGKLQPEWESALDWLAENGGNSRTIAWWDYGHWVNYLGQSRTQVRGDLAFPEMVAETADLYVQGAPEALVSYMRGKRIRYVIFDSGLFQRWAAMAYLSCYHKGMTNATFVPPEKGKPGACEQASQFEYLYVPLEGRAAGDVCDINGTPALRARSSFNRTYCLSEPEVGGTAGSRLPVFFENGTELEIGQEYVRQSIVGGRLSAVLLATYNEDSWEYRPGKGYGSLFYSGLVLRRIPGLKQVYPEGNKSGSIVIFELEEAT